MVSYGHLGPQARELLWLIAFLGNTGINSDIFRLAAVGIKSYQPVFPTTPLQDLAQESVQNFLSAFLDAEQCWDNLKFEKTITEIVSHSLLEYNRISQTYKFHVLVQD
ncbi:hypothetical protein B0J17DRAFT_674950 [Rhizoctonia solani]|nr:hypothetical protein B0J17DRAFT_674950 [Rhizoctonia solani]